jgi:hypothetical protein
VQSEVDCTSIIAITKNYNNRSSAKVEGIQKRLKTETKRAKLSKNLKEKYAEFH